MELNKNMRVEGDDWTRGAIIISIILLVISFISAITWVYWKSLGLILVPFTIAFLGTLSTLIISIFAIFHLRKRRETSTKLYKVTQDVMIISLIMSIIIVPLEIMVVKFTIAPPEYGIALALEPQTPLSIDNSPRSEWKKYVSEVSQFSIEYPPSWFVDKESLRSTRDRVVVFKYPDKGGTTLFSIELSNKKSSKIREIKSGLTEEISFGGNTAYLYVSSIHDDKFVNPRHIYIPHGKKTYIIKVAKYDSEQVREALDTFQIL